MVKTAALLILISTIFLSACAVQPPEIQSDKVLPNQWLTNDQAGIQKPTADDWWQSFQNVQLNALIDQAMSSNLSLLASLQRIEQARARVANVRAGLFPQLDAGYNASHGRSWSDNNYQTESEGDQLGFDVGYEVDLWGRLRASNEAAGAVLAATEFNHLAVALALQAEVANTYFQYLAAKDRLALAEESLANSRQLLKLVKVKLREGSTSRLELVQQQSSVVAQEAQMNSLRASLEQVEYALDVLLGQQPGTVELGEGTLAGVALPPIATGQPADLLRRRPDILEAEATLIASHANVNIARTAFYPSFRISAGASISNLLIGDPLSQAASVAANLVAPLFDGGRNRAAYHSALAAQEESLLNYYHTTLQAAAEVQSTLVRVEELSANQELLNRRLELARESRQLAALQYREGAADFITLLDAERTLIDAQDSFIQAKLERHLSAIELYRALGGSWQKKD